MRAAIYARKSTEQHDVAEEAKSVSRQVEGARAFIATKGWTLHEAHVYMDDGISGALFLGRPDFQRMLRDAEAGAFQHLVFFDLDRFGRNGRRSMEALYALTDFDITIWDFSTGQAVDLKSFGGRITTTLKTEFAQEAREERRKHTIAAMRHIAERGCVTGGRTFGYDNVGGKGQRQWIVNEAEAAVVREIYARYAAGESHRAIAGVLNGLGVPQPRAQQGRACGWSAQTVYAVLERSLYRGEIVYGRTTAAYERELGKFRLKRDGTPREHAQIDVIGYRG